MSPAPPVSLSDLGWDAFFAAQPAPEAAPSAVPARVLLESKLKYRIWIAAPSGSVGEQWAEVAGKLRHRAVGREDYPAVGDWVWVRRGAGDGSARIEGVLQRKTILARKAAGETSETQVLAANVDTAFLATSLNRDLNPRRLERYLTIAQAGRVQPVVLLTKADLMEPTEGGDTEAESVKAPGIVTASEVERVRMACPGVPIHVVSGVTGLGLDALRPYLASGRTVALLGSSGVGKSTLINRLLGADALAVREIREGDDRGRHTTTMRQMLRLPGGALVIDTPGMRELHLQDEDAAALNGVFADIETLAPACRFRDCRHDAEPGCAVRGAVEGGTLPAGHLANFHKLRREVAHAVRREDKSLETRYNQGVKRIQVAFNKRKRQSDP